MLPLLFETLNVAKRICFWCIIYQFLATNLYVFVALYEQIHIKSNNKNAVHIQKFSTATELYAILVPIMKHSNYIRTIITGIISLAWLTIGASLFLQVPYSPEFTTTIAAVITGIVFAATTVMGYGKFSAHAGKILLAIGILSLVSLLLHNGLDIANIDATIRTFILLSGIGLERVSPHQRLYNWMFLMIATKVQFVLTTILIASASDARASIFPLTYWWSLPAMMLIAAILLAMKKRKSYKFIVISTSIVAFVFAFDFITVQATFQLPSILAICVVLWPMVTERLIGYKTFISRA